MAKGFYFIYNSDMTLSQRTPIGTDLHRGDSLADRLHIQLFTAAYHILRPNLWCISNLCSSYWRFYLNYDEGALLLLPEEENDESIYHFPLPPGRACFVPSGVRFSTRCEAPEVGHLFAHFDVTGLPGLLLRELFDQPVYLPESATLRARTDELRDAMQRRNGRATGDDLVLHCRWKAALYDALALTLEALPAADRERRFARAAALEPVLPALEKIERSLGEHLSNTELAATCYWSEDYFIRRFKECVGEPPATYLRTRRIEAAAQRLLFSCDSIETIAEECGFGNRFYFSRVFTQHTGIAPAAYRKSARV